EAEEAGGRALRARAPVTRSLGPPGGQEKSETLKQPGTFLGRRGGSDAPHPGRERPPQATGQARRRPPAHRTRGSLSRRRASLRRPARPRRSPHPAGRARPGPGRVGEAALLRRPDDARGRPVARPVAGHPVRAGFEQYLSLARKAGSLTRRTFYF